MGTTKAYPIVEASGSTGPRTAPLKSSERIIDKKAKPKKWEEDKQSYLLKVFTFITGLLLGVSFAYLFLWHKLGLSYFIFTLGLVFVGWLAYPFEIVKVDSNKLTRHLVASIAILLLSSVYLFRLNELIHSLAFIGIPILYGYFLLVVHKGDVVKQFGIGYFLKFPFVWGGNLIAKFFTYISRLKFNSKLTPKSESLLKRVLLGLLIAVPFFIIFASLFTSADAKFEKAFGSFWNDLLTLWFDDFNDFLTFVIKSGIGFIVGLIIATIHYFTWLKDSEFVENLLAIKDFSQEKAKKSWDYLTVSIFLTLLNLLFVTFVIFQFKYLFAGERNIIGESANYTYAQYARKGFGELMQVTFLVYVILLVVNLKTAITTKLSNYFSKANSTLFAALTLVIAYSAFDRLRLLQEVYGYTDVRINGMLAITTVSILLFLVTASLWVKQYVKFLSVSTLLVLMLFVGSYFVIPTDYLVASLNYKRYEKFGTIDLAYMQSLSDEAIPVLVKLSDDKKLPETGQMILDKGLYDKYQSLKKSNKEWRSFNFSTSKNLKLLNEKFSKYNKEDLQKLNESSLHQNLKAFVKEYAQLIVVGNYSEAYAGYWSKSTLPNKWDSLKKL